MAGNSFGDVFRVTTFGESHGNLVGVVIDGCPSGLELDVELIQCELYRRKPGQSSMTTQRKEKDRLLVNSGVSEGKTTGAPIQMAILNEDADTEAYENIRDKFRLGHADYTYFLKYGIRDWRGGGRASARETVARVMAGAVAKQILKTCYGTEIFGCTVCIGGVEAAARDYSYAESNVLRCPDPAAYSLMMAKVEEAREANDSVGGAVEVVAKQVPVGLGEPVFDKLQAVLGHALFSIAAVKGVEIGLGHKVESLFGSQYQDHKEWRNRRMYHFTNNAGGIEGGISNGEDIIARLSVKPTPTRTGVQMTLPTEHRTNEPVVIKGRHDPIIMPRLVPVAEAMMAIALADLSLKQRAYTS